MDLSIIIPTYNRTEVLRENLAALKDNLENFAGRLEIIVVNDCKQDDGRPALVDDSRFVFVNNPKQGVSSARNLGVRTATSQHLLFMDDDIMVLPGALSALQDFIKSSDGTTALNCDWVYTPSMEEKLKKNTFGRRMLDLKLNSLRGWMGPNSKWRVNSYISDVKAASYFLYIPRTRFAQIGGYDESYPYAGFEDGDFATRLRAAGTQTDLDTRFQVYHNEFDRLELATWLSRKRHEGATRYHSVSQGNHEHVLSHPFWKQLLLNSIYLLRKPLLSFIQLMDNRLGDAFLHPLLSALEATYIWRGYHKKK